MLLSSNYVDIAATDCRFLGESIDILYKLNSDSAQARSISKLAFDVAKKRIRKEIRTKKRDSFSYKILRI